jgi:hypothetical protein
MVRRAFRPVPSHDRAYDPSFETRKCAFLQMRRTLQGLRAGLKKKLSDFSKL